VSSGIDAGNGSNLPDPSTDHPCNEKLEPQYLEKKFASIQEFYGDPIRPERRSPPQFRFETRPPVRSRSWQQPYRAVAAT